MTLKYVDEFTTPLRNDRNERIATLIWGDQVRVLDESGALVKVWPRARKGWVDPAARAPSPAALLYKAGCHMST